VQRQMAVERERMDVEVLSNQQTILRQQEEAQVLLQQIRVQQKQMKSNQDRLDQFFTTLEAVLTIKIASREISKPSSRIK
jgi:hypothetical protein